MLRHHHDLLTLNEIFWRGDYGTGAPKVVVDIGANSGIASLYFLTRRADSVITCFEPNPHNLEHLRANLKEFGHRVTICEQAVAPTNGAARFLIEPTGRYGGLAQFSPRGYEDSISVQCLAIGDVLAKAKTDHGFIDLVKIDTEGSESAIVEALTESDLYGVSQVVYESNDGHTRWLAGTSPEGPS